MNEEEVTDINLEKELSKLVRKIVGDYEDRLDKEEIREIISEIIPELDKIISIKVIQHFRELANYVLKTLK